VKDLAGRARYVLSDAFASTVAAAAASPALVRHVRAGRVVPAVFDLDDGVLRDLDGQPLEARPALWIANYVCCVTRPKILHKAPLGWFQRVVRAWGESDAQDPLGDLLARIHRPEDAEAAGVEASWRPCRLEDTVGAEHAAMLTALLDGVPDASVVWPGRFVEAVRRLARDAIVLVVDFGSALTVGDLAGLRGGAPMFYAQAASHPVDWPVFDALAAHDGLALARTADPLRMVQVAALAPAGTAIDPRNWRSGRSEQALDLLVAGKALTDLGQPTRAVRLLREAVRLDPGSAEIRWAYAQAAVAEGDGARALRAVAIGRRLEPEYDWDFVEGRGHAALGRHTDAIAAYERSIARTDHPVAWVNLGIAWEAAGEQDRARLCFETALEKDPEDEAAKDGLERLRR
jgi:tetratricopeptide (TPR) repeat protein